METILISMSKSDFQDLITESLSVCLKKQSVLQHEHSTKDNEDLLNVQQAASLVSLSVPTIYGLVSRSEIPAFKKGKRLYFSKQELTEWIKAGRRRTLEQFKSETDAFLTSQKNKRG
jgi:excisionase family DNA binding protein